MSYNFHNYKPISKALLHRIIGLQTNYKVLDIPNSCKDCDHYAQQCKWEMFPESKEYKEACFKCKDCPYKQTLELRKHIANEVKFKYINEKNKYGESAPLKLYGILLLLYYHLLANTEDGILKNVSIKQIAQSLGCNEKTVIANNQLLCKRGYIYQSNALDKNCINVCICNYKKAFLPASQGGRGYFTLSSELFEELVSIKTTNLLRIVLKQLLEFDEKGNSEEEEKQLNKSYSELRRYLPGYCKPCVIRKTLKDTNILKFDTQKDYVTIKMDRKYDCKKVKEERYEYTKNEISTQLANLTEETKNAITIGGAAFSNSYFRLKRIDNYSVWAFEDTQIVELSRLAVCYSIELVIYSLSEIYATYICGDKNKQIKNLGGLARNIITKYLSKESALLNAAV